MSTPQPDETTLLGLASRGNRQAQDELFRLVESELRKRAKAQMQHERPTQSLQTTLLLDEAYLRLVGDQKIHWKNRAQFYCCAANVMREILVDEARRRHAEKRGGGARSAELDGVPDPVARASSHPLTVLAVHEALEKLAGSHPDLVEVVELHHFGGWELKEIAEDVLHIPYPTVKKKWQRAKALLYRVISGGEGNDARAAPTRG